MFRYAANSELTSGKVPGRLQASQEQECQNEQVASSARSDASHANINPKDVSFLATLTTCGLLNPGQTILTDSAFAKYQVLLMSCDGPICLHRFKYLSDSHPGSTNRHL